MQPPLLPLWVILQVITRAFQNYRKKEEIINRTIVWLKTLLKGRILRYKMRMKKKTMKMTRRIRRKQKWFNPRGRWVRRRTSRPTPRSSSPTKLCDTVQERHWPPCLLMANSKWLTSRRGRKPRRRGRPKEEQNAKKSESKPWKKVSHSSPTTRKSIRSMVRMTGTARCSGAIRVDTTSTINQGS